MRRKVLITVSAMMLAAHLGSPVSAADPTTDQLRDIAALLETNNVQGLRDYLSSFPELAEGKTTLAVLLRRFLVESAATNNYFRFEPNLSDQANNTDDGSAGASDDPGNTTY